MLGDSKQLDEVFSQAGLTENLGHTLVITLQSISQKAIDEAQQAKKNNSTALDAGINVAYFTWVNVGSTQCYHLHWVWNASVEEDVSSTTTTTSTTSHTSSTASTNSTPTSTTPNTTPSVPAQPSVKTQKPVTIIIAIMVPLFLLLLAGCIWTTIKHRLLFRKFLRASWIESVTSGDSILDISAKRRRRGKNGESDTLTDQESEHTTLSFHSMATSSVYPTLPRNI